jgi:hypothetical protein
MEGGKDLRMSQEDQDTIIGKTIRELREVREQLTQLRAALKPYQDAFSTLDHYLGKLTLEDFRLDGEQTNSKFLPKKQHLYGQEYHVPKRAHLDIDRLLAMRDEIRQFLLREEGLINGLREMGYEAPVRKAPN